ncbi:3'(2'),5'-bisphosphate nucleotidase CysQ [Bauldia sp.]|uniref:3'(2'),5'-bisphosphate nucleotidase CysQ n=1 Tax=Bauldia sp. TaxID=2575872 RepID=UPI003BAD5157
MADATHDGDVALLKEAGAEAARIALSFFRKDPEVWTKDGGSPVSEADLAVDKFLKTTLCGARPDYGWLSEESADNPDRLERSHAFVVDPIDGTKAFVRGSEDWTVSLAVVNEGRPVAATLIAPAVEKTWWATAEGGTYENGGRLAAAHPKTLANARWVTPRRFIPRIEGVTGPIRRKYVNSLAYRLAFVAEGEVDAAIVSADSRDWDLAAADLLVQEAGARLTDLSGDLLRYNQRDTCRPMLVASVPEVFGQIVDIVGDAR